MQHLLNVIDEIWKNHWVSALNWFLVGMGTDSLAKTARTFILLFRARSFRLGPEKMRADRPYAMFLKAGLLLRKISLLERETISARLEAEQMYQSAGKVAAEDCPPEIPLKH